MQLTLLSQKTVHQIAVFAAGTEAALQQLREGAQSRQRVAQLMDQQAQLLLLILQAGGQTPPLMVEQQRLGEAEGHGLQALTQRLRPVAARALHLQGAQQPLAVAQRQPAPLLGRLAQTAVLLDRRQAAPVPGPLTDGQQRRRPVGRLMGHVDHQRTHLRTVGELVELVGQEAEKPL